VSTLDDLLWRITRAGAEGSAAAAIQPPAPPQAPLRWMKAACNWVNLPGNGSYVRAWACADADGADADAGVRLKVKLPRTPGADPNVVTDQVIGCLAAADGSLVAVTGYLDAPIGTVRLWTADAIDPPPGWTECIYGGTPGRPSARAEYLQGAFPRGRDPTDPAADAVAMHGGQDMHCHTLTRNQPAESCSTVQINEGTWMSILLGLTAESNLPPWCVVRFIERYDNSQL